MSVRGHDFSFECDILQKKLSNTIWTGGIFPSSAKIPVADLNWLKEREFGRRDWINPNPEVDENMVRHLRDIMRSNFVN